MNKLVYVTGAGRGIGRAISVKLAKEGYAVSGCARTLSELEKTKKESEGRVRIQTVDVREPASISAWMKAEALATGARPWGLVTAAGVYGPIGPFLDNDWEKWKEALEINLYGTLLCVKIFAQALIANKWPGRIILLSGGGATQPMPNFSSYAACKSAVVRWGETLALELADSNITVNSIAPGAVVTQLTREILSAGPEKAGREFYEKTVKQIEQGGADPTKPANLSVYLMGETSAPVTGRLISAIWDPWEELHQSEILKNREMYTLRRLVPAEQK